MGVQLPTSTGEFTGFLVAINSSSRKVLKYFYAGLLKDILKLNWLVVSTPLKNISQNGNLPQIGVKIKNI